MLSLPIELPTLNICLPRKNKNERASEGIGTYYELRRKIFIRMSKIAPASRYSMFLASNKKTVIEKAKKGSARKDFVSAS